jgi:hypothetical protein
MTEQDALTAIPRKKGSTTTTVPNGTIRSQMVLNRQRQWIPGSACAASE